MHTEHSALSTQPSLDHQEGQTRNDDGPNQNLCNTLLCCCILASVCEPVLSGAFSYRQLQVGVRVDVPGC